MVDSVSAPRTKKLVEVLSPANAVFNTKATNKRPPVAAPAPFLAARFHLSRNAVIWAVALSRQRFVDWTGNKAERGQAGVMQSQ